MRKKRGSFTLDEQGITPLYSEKPCLYTCGGYHSGMKNNFTSSLCCLCKVQITAIEKYRKMFCALHKQYENRDEGDELGVESN